MKQHRLISISLLAGFFLLTACGSAKEADIIADAQNCLDHATSETVGQCVSKVDGMESQAAYMIRCSGKFVKEGFNEPTKLAGVLTNIAGGNTGSDGSTGMMAALAFKAESTSALNSASAKEAFGYCTQAKSAGLTLLSGLTKTASVLGDLGLGTTTITGDQLQALMGTLQNDPVAQEAVGTAVVAIYNSSCAAPDQTTTGAYCEQFRSAVTALPSGVSDPAALGQQIMKCYNDPTLPGCTGF
jgi:hypothetical protein